MGYPKRSQRNWLKSEQYFFFISSQFFKWVLKILHCLRLAKIRKPKIWSYLHPNPSLRLSGGFTKNYLYFFFVLRLIKKILFFSWNRQYKCTSIFFLIYTEKKETFKISFSPLISFAGRCTNFRGQFICLLIYQTKLSCYIYYPQNILKFFISCIMWLKRGRKLY